ncbi:MAG: serine/threonine-protein kinase, partial [Geitlerinemataceae cyanobacterium]
EIQVLRDIDFPNIPRYLDSFQTSTGFCMVQEYKDAPSLAQSKKFTPPQVKKIAIAVLEILKYLQNRIPPVIHRDLKPENILVDDRLNVYLVDFGFARMGGGEVAVSSVVKGTLGFMPPEQMFNRQITIASDLYSLGATLICLLTGTLSTDVGSLMDDTGKIHFQQRLPQLSIEFAIWLQKMVAPNYKDRYQSAEEALDVLISLDVVKVVKKGRLSMAIASVAAIALMGTGYLAFRLANPSNLESIQSPELPKFESILTADFQGNQPGDRLEKISLEEKSPQTVYFYINIDRIEHKQHEGTCRILDPGGNLVYVGKAPLLTVNKSLDSWCNYTFEAVDRTGEWIFEFYLDRNKISEEKLKISSSFDFSNLKSRKFNPKTSNRYSSRKV